MACLEDERPNDPKVDCLEALVKMEWQEYRIALLEKNLETCGRSREILRKIACRHPTMPAFPGEGREPAEMLTSYQIGRINTTGRWS
jgi:hypothetical protein